MEVAVPHRAPDPGSRPAVALRPALCVVIACNQTWLNIIIASIMYTVLMQYYHESTFCYTITHDVWNAAAAATTDDDDVYRIDTYSCIA